MHTEEYSVFFIVNTYSNNFFQGTKAKKTSLQYEYYFIARKTTAPSEGDSVTAA